MRGHNYDHGRGDVCKVCREIHIHPRGMLGKKHPNTFFKKGMIPWNKDLTKEIDLRVATAAQNMRGKKRSEISCLNMSIAQKKKHAEDPDYRVRQHPPGSNQKRRLTLIGHEVSEATRIKLSKSRIGKTYEELYGKERAEEVKRKIGKSLEGSVSWHAGLTKETDPRLKRLSDHLKKVMKGRIPKACLIRGPNKTEQKITGWLDELGFGFEFTGDTPNKNSGLMPDWTLEDKKLIIEYDCDYWHNDLHADMKRNSRHNKYGYRVLVLSDNDIYNKEEFQKNVGGFVYGSSD